MKKRVTPTPVKTAAIYARVSTDDQNCGLQLTELRGYAERMGWQVVEYTEKMSSVKPRAQLDRLMDDARHRKIDVVLCWKLDRFGRSLAQLTRDIQLLDSYKVRFICPNQSIDTDQNNPASRLLLHMLAAIAEFERALIRERVKSGLAEYKRAYDAGKIGKERQSRSGRNLAPHRPRRIFDRDKARKLREKGVSLRKIAATLKVPLSTVVDSLRTASN